MQDYIPGMIIVDRAPFDTAKAFWPICRAQGPVRLTSFPRPIAVVLHSGNKWDRQWTLAKVAYLPNQEYTTEKIDGVLWCLMAMSGFNN